MRVVTLGSAPMAPVRHNALRPVAIKNIGARTRGAFSHAGARINTVSRIAAVKESSSRFADIAQAPPDPILGISDAFKKDSSSDKLNLGVGAYRTEELKPYVLNVVKKAEERLMVQLNKGSINKEYLTIDGLSAFNKATAVLLLGADSPVIQEQRIATCQGLSGTGSLRVGAQFLSRFRPGTSVYLSNPTWGNHKNIFTDGGVQWKEYRYYDKNTVGLDFDGMVADLEAAPNGSVVVLHGCAHNPTGIDPTKEQWSKIADLVIAKGHLPFFDVAYQGFASGSLIEDAFAPRLFAQRGIEFMCSQSYSKNLGLYNERIGAISMVLNDKESQVKCSSQLKRLARAMYSNPPAHGAQLVAEVIGDPKLFAEWEQEMEMMAGRIKNVRALLQTNLTEKCPGRDWSFVTRQIGMFSYTGLTKKQVENMTNKHHVYMTMDGRISLAGLSAAKCDYLSNAIADSWMNH